VHDWKDIPTIKDATGADIHYLMLRGIFGAPGMPKEVVDWYADLLKKVSETPEWRKYMDDGALKPAFATGAEYVAWLTEAEGLHRDLMTKGGLIKK
jgi:tripartite-type tricarboxylate transporter receptor subunit TctC